MSCQMLFKSWLAMTTVLIQLMRRTSCLLEVQKQTRCNFAEQVGSQ